MAGLCAPLSTLRRCPRGHLRMTRGRCGSLLLHRDGLAPSTPCRSPGALRYLLRIIETANAGLLEELLLLQVQPSWRSRPVTPLSERAAPLRVDHFRKSRMLSAISRAC